MNINELLKDARYADKELKNISLSEVDIAVREILQVFPDLEEDEVKAYIFASIESEHGYVKLLDESMREVAFDNAVLYGELKDEQRSIYHQIGQIERQLDRLGNNVCRAWDLDHAKEDIFGDIGMLQDRVNKLQKQVLVFQIVSAAAILVSFVTLLAR